MGIALLTPTKPIDFRLAHNRALRVAVFRRDGFTCQDCGWRPQGNEIPADYDGRYTIGDWPYPQADRVLHMDHVIPRAAGGPSILSNLSTRCGPCNVRKGDRAA
jgi:5-methylcytosine-specific restriction endonuclease McrA